MMQLNLCAPAEIRQPDDDECLEIRRKLLDTDSRTAQDVREYMRRETEAMFRGGYRYWLCESVFKDRLQGDAPKILVVKGVPDLSLRKVAIVGPRRPDDYGVEMTKLFSSAIAASGVVIISGGAAGIDTVAHESALAVGGRTFCILGSGFDRPHPPSNTELFAGLGNPDRHASSCLISEYPPDMGAQPGFFPRRNRLVAALADAVIVIQAAKGSGALITAEIARGIKVPVFTIPADIAFQSSSASNDLLGRGATAITKPTDLNAVEALKTVKFPKRWPTGVRRQAGSRLPWKTNSEPMSAAHHEPASDTADFLEAIRQHYLENGRGPDFEYLCKRLNKTVGAVQSGLLQLELRGAIYRLPGGVIVPSDPIN
jgi:DNA processing protein